MDQHVSAQAQESVAADAFAALVGTRQIPPFSSRPGGLDVDDAYRVTPRVRRLYEAGGARVIGRKVGFTNRTIWPEYGVYAPIWGYVFDRSLHDLEAERDPFDARRQGRFVHLCGGCNRKAEYDFGLDAWFGK